MTTRETQRHIDHARASGDGLLADLLESLHDRVLMLEALLRARAPAQSPFSIEKHGRAWAVRDSRGGLICLALYKVGAEEVVRRLQERAS